MKKCKITVIRKLYHKDLVDKYIPYPDYGTCDIFDDGEVYYTRGSLGTDMPHGFCPAAWDAIGKEAAILASGGKVYGDKTIHISSCNDGTRPVIFKLEAVDCD